MLEEMLCRFCIHIDAGHEAELNRSEGNRGS